MTGYERAFAHPASRLALEVFRLNGALVATGDALVAPLGLTSARWQVLGAVAQAQGGLPVAGIARNMGLVRQSVLRVVNDLVALGALRLAPNPHHKRAQLVQLTPKGAALFDDASVGWIALADAFLADLEPVEVERAISTLRTIRDQLQEAANPNDPTATAPEGE